MTALAVQGKSLSHHARSESHVLDQGPVIAAPAVVGVALPRPPRFGAGPIEALNRHIVECTPVDRHFVQKPLERQKRDARDRIDPGPQEQIFGVAGGDDRQVLTPGHFPAIDIEMPDARSLVVYGGHHIPGVAGKSVGVRAKSVEYPIVLVRIVGNAEIESLTRLGVEQKLAPAVLERPLRPLAEKRLRRLVAGRENPRDQRKAPGQIEVGRVRDANKIVFPVQTESPAHQARRKGRAPCHSAIVPSQSVARIALSGP